MLSKQIPLGIYEKALPAGECWQERLRLAKELGFDFVEMSVDETDARLARLDWSVPATTANATGWHGALMISAFLGTVISLERAVALGRGRIGHGEAGGAGDLNHAMPGISCGQRVLHRAGNGHTHGAGLVGLGYGAHHVAHKLTSSGRPA